MRFSRYIGKRIFCIIKPQKFINPKKKTDLSQTGKARQK
jgi:hypothetical protein